jgi:hypothetical protein
MYTNRHDHRLDRLVVRPCTSAECEEWNRLVETHHDLHSSSMMGEQIRYFALIDNVVVACLGWGAAVFKSRHRESWIGWENIQQRQRLHLVAQNARFCIVPAGVNIPNMASKVLAMNIDRLSSDWRERYNHNIYLAETFIDADRIGTCYKAAGWVALGITRGFRRIGTQYQRHGIIRTYMVKPLITSTKTILCADSLPEDRVLNWIDAKDLPLDGESGLFTLLKKRITDTRKSWGLRYPLEGILGLLIAGLIAGNQTVEDIAAWARILPENVLRRFRCQFSKKHGAYRAPCANTYRYCLQDTDPNELEKIAVEWLGSCGINTTNTIIAIDGKTIRGATDAEGNMPKLVSMYLPEHGVVIDQTACRRDHDEAPTARDIINKHDLTGSIVTTDAAHTNPESAQQIRKKTATIYLHSKKTSPTFSLTWSRRSKMQTPITFA